MQDFPKNKNITLQQAKSSQSLPDLFHLPLSVTAYDQLQSIADILDSVHPSIDSDRWGYIWGPSFLPSKAYKHLMGHCDVLPAFRWLWKSCCQNKHKVFFWLLLKDRLNTRELLRRKNMDLPSSACVFCQPDLEESVLLLFLYC